MSYKSVLLYPEDVSLLASPSAWLNDACLAFAYELLTHEVLSGTVGVVCVQPCVVSLALWEEDAADRAAALAPLALPVARLVLMPLVHGSDPLTPASGGHWSLLAFVREGDAVRAMHFDSGCGDAAACRVARAAWARMWPLVHGEGRGALPPTPPIADGGCPKQRDDASCGVFVAALSERLARRAAAGLPPFDPSVVAEVDTGAYRLGMLENARRLAQACV